MSFVRRPVGALLLLVLLSLVTSLPSSGASRPLDAHEAYVARTATEMRRRDDWIMPYFNGVPRLQKPPLSYWLAMVAHALGGADRDASVREWEARAASIVAGIATVLLTFCIAWLAFDDCSAGVLSAALFATTSAFSTWSRSAQPEMLYTFFCTLQLLGFVLARRAAADTWRAHASTLLGWCAFAAAVLTKGPLLPLFTLCGTWTGMFVASPRTELLRVFRPWLGLLVIAIGALPWIVLVVVREPDAFAYWRAQMFDRTGGVASAWWRPIELLYVWRCAELLLPWTALFFIALVRPWRRRREANGTPLTLWFTCAVPMLLLSFSSSGKDYYLLPIVPAVCALMGGETLGLARAWFANPHSHRRVRSLLQAHASIFAMIIVAVAVIACMRHPEGSLPRSQVLVLASTCLPAFVACIAAWTLSENRPSAAAACLVTCAAYGLLAWNSSALEVATRRSADGEFARALANHARPDQPLFVVGGNPQLAVYYADHPVKQVRRDELIERLSSEPDALIVDVEAELARTPVTGRVLARELDTDGDRVLLEPTLPRVSLAHGAGAAR